MLRYFTYLATHYVPFIFCNKMIYLGYLHQVSFSEYSLVYNAETILKSD